MIFIAQYCEKKPFSFRTRKIRKEGIIELIEFALFIVHFPKLLASLLTLNENITG